MKTTIASEKEKILRDFKVAMFSSSINMNDFISESLDHIASVARQEGREEGIEEVIKHIQTNLVESNYGKVLIEDYDWNCIVAKLAGKEEGKE